MNGSDLEPLETACEWRTDQLGDSYVFQLTDAHLDELDRALTHAEASCDRPFFRARFGIDAHLDHALQELLDRVGRQDLGVELLAPDRHGYEAIAHRSDDTAHLTRDECVCRRKIGRSYLLRTP